MSLEKYNKQLIVFIVGGSGTGKTTLAKKLIEQGYFEKAITCTSRKPRVGEENFIDYIFSTPEDMKRMYESGELLEYTEFGGNWYGCPIKSVYGVKPVVIVMEYEGVKKSMEILSKDSNLILAPVFLEPTSEDEIRRRILKRGSTSEELESRLKERKKEMKWSDYPYVLKIKAKENVSKEDLDEIIQESVNKVSALIDIYAPKSNTVKNKKIFK